uniref:Uncharacterized protein n=1 Tax=Anguilla anguilla TaxID=7936 RepID=A0A0E9RNJ6_ANGAN
MGQVSAVLTIVESSFHHIFECHDWFKSMVV